MAASEIFEQVRPVLERYAVALEQAGLRPERMYLYGSYASGHPNEWSDMDVAVVSADFSGNVIEDQLLLMRQAWRIDARIEPHPFRSVDFHEDNPWAAEILESGVRIV